MTAVALNRADGGLTLRFERRGVVTALADLHQRPPCRAMFPREEPGRPPTAVLITTAGGLTGGDRLALDLSVGPGGAALITGQAAEKIYRSSGADVSITVDARVEAGAALDYLPQDTILFDGARLERRTTIDLAADARFAAIDLLVFGRSAMGEAFSRGDLFDRWEIRRAGKPLWIDVLAFEGDPARGLAAPWGFDGATAAATLIYAAPDAAPRLEGARAALTGFADGQAGVTIVGGVLLARLIGRNTAAVRRAIAVGFAWFSTLAPAGEAKLPKVWSL